MNKSMLKTSIVLMVVIFAFSFMMGCGSKTPKTTTTHHESGSAALITTEIYEECMANNDIQGAKDALETLDYLLAFYCNAVYYEDVKNRNYNNIEYDIGGLQIAVAAYNENNDESAMDVEVDWICQFNSCTQEQHDAVAAYVEWYHKAQNGHYEGTIKEYRNKVNTAYDELKWKYGFDVFKEYRYDKLTPAQFKEVQNYMKDPNYQVDISVWE
jgi:hypothetical protein